MNYERYFNRHGQELLPWSASPDGPFSDRSGSFDYRSSYAQHDIQFLFEFYPGWHGLFLVGGREVTIQRVVESWKWNFYRADSLTSSLPDGREFTGTWQYVLIGAGWSHPVARKTSLAITATYTFSVATGGLKVRAGIRRFIF